MAGLSHLTSEQKAAILAAFEEIILDYFAFEAAARI